MTSANITYPMRQLHCNLSHHQNHHPPYNKVNGHAVPLAPMQRFSRPVLILLGTWPRRSWRLQHQEPTPQSTTSPNGISDRLTFTALGSLQFSFIFSLFAHNAHCKGVQIHRYPTCIHSTSEHNMLEVRTLYGSGLTPSRLPT